MKTQKSLSEKVRPDLHTLSLGDEAWGQARALAKDDNRSISSFFRNVIKNLYMKKNQEKVSS